MLTFAIIVVAVIIVILVAVQNRSAGIGVFGGAGGDSVYQTRRGLEKFLFILTVVSIAVFALLGIANLIL
ncbi:MAG: preprotein translocase subunit SecG [Candidatus Colwellbacteria bacterium]|nr:preprotein translocase subunit SecG [Candidatus Colwellbacteria bacterium]